ncbi:MAG TPA: cyclase family protein [Chloroflexota bacterium]
MSRALIDLSQRWSSLTPGWPTYGAPLVQWAKRLSTERVNAQRIETLLHVGTHIDAPLHFVSNGKDVASLPLDRLYGPAVVVDISDECGDHDIYTPEHITRKVEVREGDILIIHTGYHRYGYDQPEADEVRYFCKHPGPNREFAEWCLDMKLRWIGVDCGSADHPMNTIIRRLRPDVAAEAESHLGRSLDDIFPDSGYQIMHTFLFPHDIVHCENVGGDLDEVLGQRCEIGAFPWRFVGGEAAMCRIVAFR